MLQNIAKPQVMPSSVYEFKPEGVTTRLTALQETTRRNAHLGPALSLNFNASRTISAFRKCGSAMVTQIAWIHQMKNIAKIESALSMSSNVPTVAVFH